MPLFEIYGHEPIQRLFEVYEVQAQAPVAKGFFDNLIQTKLADNLNAQLRETARAVSGSAETIEKSIKASSNLFDEGTKQIGKQIDALSKEISQGSEQSSNLSATLNRLTKWIVGAAIVSALAAVASAGAAAYSAFEAKQQIDLLRKQSEVTKKPTSTDGK